MQNLKSLIRPIVPRGLLSAYRRFNAQRREDRARAMSTRDVFTDIYANNRWGGARGDYNSGNGSSTAAIVSPYIECIRRRLTRLEADELTVVDLGCGDFSVGRQLAGACATYIGVDIVEGLIERNENEFGSGRISFQCLDIIEDPLPAGNVCFLRQVLQHLSNAQILRILPKLERFDRVFVTEHQPSSGRLGVPNLDKAHGGDIRVARNSGVYLEHPPFNIPAHALELLLEVPGGAAPDGCDPGVIRTFLLRH